MTKKTKNKWGWMEAYPAGVPLVPRPAIKVSIGEANFFFIKALEGRNAGHFNRRTTQRKEKLAIFTP
jgi:hypothetical protein